VSFREKLAIRAKKAGINVQTDVISGLDAYFELLRKWNRKVSLTALPVEAIGDEAIDRLLIEPLLASKYLSGDVRSVVDVGSGGGSPAIPLAIANPGVAMRMVESKTRKAAFLREAVRQIALEHATVEGCRLEELLARPELHEGADVVTMRAVKPDLKTLMGVQAFLKQGGALLLFHAKTVGEPAGATPFLLREATHALLPALNSSLSIYRKYRS
jgi:16S rRNA (guanine527-N7)-methyltransferase